VLFQEERSEQRRWEITETSRFMMNSKVYGLGDLYSPKHATLSQEQRYENVRIIVVYQTDQVPVLPAAQRS
jgi:hypothetical protein